MEKNNINGLFPGTTGKYLLKIAGLSFLTLIIIAATMGCEILIPGLGDEIDITPPVVAITSHLDNETELKLPVRNGNNWQIEILTDNFLNGPMHICIVVTDYTSKTCEASISLNFSN